MNRSLDPAHIADLRQSGLTDSTIDLMHCEAVRPKEIPIESALSAYRLSYFNIDGTLNCFSRLKFVPEVVAADGKKMKYWQEKGSLPHLYLPPLLNWRTVAKDPKAILTIAEGEKKRRQGVNRALSWQGSAESGIGPVPSTTATDSPSRYLMSSNGRTAQSCFALILMSGAKRKCRYGKAFSLSAKNSSNVVPMSISSNSPICTA